MRGQDALPWYRSPFLVGMNRLRAFAVRWFGSRVCGQERAVEEERAPPSDLHVTWNSRSRTFEKDTLDRKREW